MICQKTLHYNTRLLGYDMIMKLKPEAIDMINTYSTSDVAKLIGIHPNTVRLYEDLGLITRPERKTNGYRVFTDYHLIQFRIARLAFQVEVLQNGLRKQAAAIVKSCASGDMDKALYLTDLYLRQISEEKLNGETAIQIAGQILSGHTLITDDLLLTRTQAALYLHITVDTLRSWERNGLLEEAKTQNGRRVYTSRDLERLIIIKSLRCANYSLSAILRMLSALSLNPEASIRDAIDTPRPDDDILTACDHLLTSLEQARENAEQIIILLSELKKTESVTPHAGTYRITDDFPAPCQPDK